jgi:hypothetical protein
LLCWFWASKVSERPALKSSFDFESFRLKKEIKKKTSHQTWSKDNKVQFYIFLNYT